MQIELIKVEGGTFWMGDSDGLDIESPVHEVTLSDFKIGKYPITQAQWAAVMGSNPSFFKGDDLPVENISWYDCQRFIEKLNAQSGEVYRLPTEAEWEFAARGGNYSKGYMYSGSDNLDEVGWYSDNSNDQTHSVGQKKANELGLYDMSGNVWEWCSDWWWVYDRQPAQNPRGRIIGDYRVTRGGSWYYQPEYCCVDFRGRSYPNLELSGGGLRIAQDC